MTALALQRPALAITFLGGLAVLTIGLSSSACAQVAYVDTQGREWREVVGTTGRTWLQFEAVCPTDGITPCEGTLGGLDVTGWVWATDAQVTSLLAEFVPEIVNQPSLGGPTYVLPAMGFTGIFDPTYEFYTTFGGYNFVGGWTATEEDGLGGVAAVAAQWNPFNSAWDVGAVADVTTANAFRGAWLVKLPKVVCDADLDGTGVVDAADLGALLGAWGEVGEGEAAADLNGDGFVDAADLGALLGAWGDC